MTSIISNASKALEKLKPLDISLEGSILKSDGNLKNFKSAILKVKDDGTLIIVENVVEKISRNHIFARKTFEVSENIESFKSMRVLGGL
eukprot:gene8495-319_t